MKFIQPSLIKVSGNPNHKMIWSIDRLFEIQQIVPEAYVIKRKNGAGIDYDDDLPIPVIGQGRGLRFLVPFFNNPTFVRSSSGCLRSCLRIHFGYTLEDMYCQMVFGDRNLRPVDPTTNEVPKFAGMIKGFFESSSRSSKSAKINRRYIWTEESWGCNRIISAANMKLNKYHSCKLYLAKWTDPNAIKIGFTHFDDLKDRVFWDPGADKIFGDMIEVAYGDGNSIILLERDIKLEFNIPNELFDKSIINEVLDYIYSHNDGMICENRKKVEEFICR